MNRTPEAASLRSNAASSHPAQSHISAQKKMKNNFVAAAQFTNRRTRTLFTKPSIRKVDQILDPP